MGVFISNNISGNSSGNISGCKYGNISGTIPGTVSGSITGNSLAIVMVLCLETSTSGQCLDIVMEKLAPGCISGIRLEISRSGNMLESFLQPLNKQR